MSLARRLPKRGFTNNFKNEYQIVNLDKIEELEISEISPQQLFANGLNRSALKPVKILGSGELSKKVNIKATTFSASAKLKIEKAGGTAIEE